MIAYDKARDKLLTIQTRVDESPVNVTDDRYYDTEQAHLDADHVLVDFLAELGYGEIVQLWRGVPKWYA